MPKIAKELTPLALRHLKKPGRHPVGGVPGLLLNVDPSGAKRWVLRVMIGGQRRDVGLGGYPGVTLAGAREEARELRRQIRNGEDPIETRRAAAEALRLAAMRSISFREAATRCHQSKAPNFRSARHRQDWINSLEKHAFPVIGNEKVQSIGIPEVLAVLKPIWETKTETASRVRQRIESVLTWATVSGYREGENPARWEGNLKEILPTPSKIQVVNHQPALPWQRVPEFCAALRTREGLGARALEFLIYTAARPGEIRQATWDQIDLENGLWTIPAARMKTGRLHRVPLSGPAQKMLRELPRLKGTDFVFPTPNGLKISDATIAATIKRMHRSREKEGLEGYIDPSNGRIAVPHGFRSAFKDWARSATTFPDEVSELALAHVNSDATRAAYARDELLAQRQELMEAWAEFILDSH